MKHIFSVFNYNINKMIKHFTKSTFLNYKNRHSSNVLHSNNNKFLLILLLMRKKENIFII